MSKIRTVVVKVFTPEGSVKAQLNTERFQCTAGKVKKAVGETLKLKPQSLRIFGLFGGPLVNPKELLQDSDVLPEDTAELSFLRCSFDEEEEIKITLEDDCATQLLFGELKHQYNHFKILPVPKYQHIDIMDRILANENLVVSGQKLENQKEFVKVVRSLPLYYWSCYYRADYCTLHSSLKLSRYVGQDTELHVVLTAEELVLLEPDTNNKQKLFSQSWNMIRSVRMQKSPKMLIKFEVSVIDNAEESSDMMLKYISIETNRNEYLYSLTVYILKLQENKQAQGLLLPPVPQAMAKAEMITGQEYEFVNNTFSGTIPQ